MKTFRTIQIEGSKEAYGYPSPIPLPKKDDHVLFQNKRKVIAGYVKEVKFIVIDEVCETRIIIEK